MIFEIEILWHTPETKKKENAGMAVDPSEMVNREITLYRIDAIGPHDWGEHKFCDIFSGGEQWIAPYSYEEMKALIEEKMAKS